MQAVEGEAIARRLSSSPRPSPDQERGGEQHSEHDQRKPIPSGEAGFFIGGSFESANAPIEFRIEIKHTYFSHA